MFLKTPKSRLHFLNIALQSPRTADVLVVTPLDSHIWLHVTRQTGNQITRPIQQNLYNHLKVCNTFVYCFIISNKTIIPSSRPICNTLDRKQNNPVPYNKTYVLENTEKQTTLFKYSLTISIYGRRTICNHQAESKIAFILKLPKSMQDYFIWFYKTNLSGGRTISP